MEKLLRLLNPEVKDYILNNIRPMYRSHDKAHDVDHFDAVVTKGLKVGIEFKYDNLDMVAVACACHDIGIGFGHRDVHHINSHKKVLEPEIFNSLSKWFSKKEIEEIANACLEHRASSGKVPDSMLSRIVCCADRNIDLEQYIKRCIQFGEKNRPNSTTYDDVYNDTYTHMKEKYGTGGYMKMVLNYGNDIQQARKIRNTIDNEEAFKKSFNKVYFLVLRKKR